MTVKDLVTKILQLLVAAGLGAAAYWFSSVQRAEGEYSYLFTHPYFVQCVGIALVLIFSPQIVALGHRAMRVLSSTWFHAVRALVTPKERWVGGVALATCLVAALAVADFAQGSAFYAQTVLRELKHHSTIARSQLIARASGEAAEGQLGGGAETVGLILTLFKGHAQNAHMEQWLKRVNDARVLGRLLQERAEAFVAAGDRLWAVRFSRASLDIWPENDNAKATLESVQDLFEAKRDSLVALFTSCNGQKLNLSTLDEGALSLLVRNPADTYRMISERPTDSSLRHLQLSLCGINQTDPTCAVNELESEMFGLEMEARCRDEWY